MPLYGAPELFVLACRAGSDRVVPQNCLLDCDLWCTAVSPAGASRSRLRTAGHYSAKTFPPLQTARWRGNAGVQTHRKMPAKLIYIHLHRHARRNSSCARRRYVPGRGRQGYPFHPRHVDWLSPTKTRRMFNREKSIIADTREFLWKSPSRRQQVPPRTRCQPAHRPSRFCKSAESRGQKRPGPPSEKS